VSGLEAVAPGWEWVPKASAIAREAGARLREFFSQGVAPQYKADEDIVTVAASTPERLIR